jgi:MFS transporter, AAHS family, 4-hydroxybenzoate transporter
MSERCRPDIAKGGKDLDQDRRVEVPTIDVTRLLDEKRLGSARIMILLVCGLVAVMDGFDVQVIGIAAPSIARSIHVPVKAFGEVFSSTLLGVALGAAMLGTLSDKIGRKPVLVATTAAFGLFSIATACVSSLDELLLARFLAGVGLGGAMPNFIGMVSDYAPGQKRGALVALLWTGFPIGGVLAGVVAAHTIELFGWQSVFYFGGFLPIVLAAVIWSVVPESLRFLLRRGHKRQEALRTIQRLWPEARLESRSRFVIGGSEPSNVSVGLLFSGARARTTILLWASFFSTFLLLITCAVWTPVLLQTGRTNLSGAAVVLIAFNLGSVVGTPMAGLLIQLRRSRAVLALVFVCCAVVLALVGQARSSVSLTALLMTVAGLTLGTGSSALIAMVAQFYPQSVRSTGLGYAMGLGRLGSFTGPLVIGVLVGWNWSVGHVFEVIASPALAAALATALVRAAPSSRPDPSTAEV